MSDLEKKIMALLKEHIKDEVLDQKVAGIAIEIELENDTHIQIGKRYF
ncbi:hypothetical protein SDC9_81501 [bioreactor metagenome]|uniref:Uncharacterized protein n=1 Tax=bioreactor metagenome TaxID=1076179 RepID=A0A644Z4I7_9ZZZZ